MNVFFSAGEASGDAYAAALVSEIARLRPGTRFSAVGGRRLSALGVPLVAESSHWGAMGILEAIKVGPKVMRGYRQALAALARDERGVCVPIDFGFMNVKLAREAKRLGWKVLYFVPPGSWRRNKQAADLAPICDAIVTPFEWSATMLNQMGAKAHWFGHPLKQLVAAAPAGPRERKGIAVLPGSRQHEIENNLPVIAEAARALGQPVEFGVAASFGAGPLRELWQRFGGPEGAQFTEGDLYGVLKRARAAIVCSGTATLEAALCGCPTVVMYRGSKMMELEYRIRKPKFDYFSLPNILMERQVVPELLQWAASPERVQSETAALLEEGPAREAQVEAFQDLDRLLGPSDCLTQTAKLVLGIGATQLDS